MADSSDVTEIEKDLVKTVTDVQGELANRLFIEIVNGNPVATGFSRSNWNISLGEPDYTVSGDRRADATYDPPAASVPDNPSLLPIFISNGVPYIGLLEEGKSDQAPSGFVAVAIAKVQLETETL